MKERVLLNYRFDLSHLRSIVQLVYRTRVAQIVKMLVFREGRIELAIIYINCA